MPPAANGSGPSDEALMASAQADDVEAFAELYDRHAARALRVARAVCRDDGRAEDAVQDGFLAVWRNRARFRPESGSFRAWSMRIVHNRAIDARRAAAARPHAQSEDEAGERPDTAAHTPPEQVISRSEGAALHGSLRELPKAQAEVIVLAYYGGLSQSEIAAQLSLPQGTVKGRMRLGLEKLRVRIAARS